MDVSFELHDLVLTMDRQAESILKPLGLTLRQHTALVIISQHPGLRNRDLAGGLGISAPGATGVVKTLARQGWVHDLAPAGSGNVQALHLTEAGQSKLLASTQALGSSFDDIVRGAGHDPVLLARTLRSITERLR